MQMSTTLKSPILTMKMIIMYPLQMHPTDLEMVMDYCSVNFASISINFMKNNKVYN